MVFFVRSQGLSCSSYVYTITQLNLCEHRSKSLAKLRSVSRICKLGAWLVAAAGLIATGIYVSTIIPVIPFFRQYQQQSPYAYTALTSMISALFMIVVPTLFFTIILYAMGTLLEYMSAEAKITATQAVLEEENDNGDLEDGRIKIVPIPEMR